MEVRIGVLHSPREIALETTLSIAEVTALVDASLSTGAPLSLEDDKGRLVIVAGSAIAYVDIAGAETRRIGFGN